MMLKETLQEIAKRQKTEIERFGIGIERNKLSEIYLRTEHAIVISGIRRCGKSTLLKQISKKLNGKNPFYSLKYLI